MNKLASCKLKVFLKGTHIVFMKNDFSSLECDGNTKVGKMLRGQSPGVLESVPDSALWQVRGTITFGQDLYLM